MMISQTNKLSTKRDVEIDLLRIIAAFYVIILHIMGRGGIYHALLQDDPFKRYAAFCLYFWSFCAVNLFGLISGYANYSNQATPPKSYQKYLKLWLEVVFYNVLITVVSYWLVPEYDGQRSLLICFFPVSKNLHWYFTAYTLLFPLIPLLDAGIRNCDNKLLLRLVAVIIFVIAPIENIRGCFKFSWGYSPIWLLLLYLIGAILKKTRICDRISPVVALVCIGALILLTTWVRMYFDPEFLTRCDLIVTNHYVFLPHILCAILHIPLVSRFRPGKRISRLISFAAAGSFAVYIINTQSFIWNYYMDKHFESWAQNSTYGLLVRVLATAFVFVFVSVAVDYLRRRLFDLIFRRQ